MINKKGIILGLAMALSVGAMPTPQVYAWEKTAAITAVLTATAALVISYYWDIDAKFIVRGDCPLDKCLLLQKDGDGGSN